MGPNNGENQSGGVTTTLEAPQVTSVAPEGGNGLLPTPGASAPEATEVIAQAEDVAAKAWAGGEQTAASTMPPVQEASSQVQPAPEVKPLDPLKPLGTPEMANLNATHNSMVAEKAAAQATPPKPGLGNRLLGFIGLRGGAKMETVQPANPVPDHLKDGVTPPVPNVTPEAAAAVNQEPVAASPLETTPDTSTNAPASSSPDMTSSSPSPSEPVVSSLDSTPTATSSPTETASVDASPTTAAEAPHMDTASAVSEAESIVSNAAGTNAALDEIDKTATDAMNATASTGAKVDEAESSEASASPSEAFPSYGTPTEANASSGPTVTAPAQATETASAWPSTSTAEPTTSGPAAAVEPPVAPAAPEYKPSADMAPAGEATAPTTPTNWSVDASAVHPDAPVVGSAPSATEAPSSVPSPEPNALNLEANPTPLPGAPTEAPPPFGTGMPPLAGEAPSIVGAPVEPEATSTPTTPEPAVDPAMSSVTAAPGSSEATHMDMLGQAGQVAAAAEAAGGALPADGRLATAVENTSSALPTEEATPSPTGNVLEQATAVADAAGAANLGTPTETSSMTEPTLDATGPNPSPAGTPSGSGTGTPPLATS